jgi:hypothetical protein
MARRSGGRGCARHFTGSSSVRSAPRRPRFSFLLSVTLSCASELDRNMLAVFNNASWVRRSRVGEGQIKGRDCAAGGHPEALRESADPTGLSRARDCLGRIADGNQSSDHTAQALITRRIELPLGMESARDGPRRLTMRANPRPSFGPDKTLRACCPEAGLMNGLFSHSAALRGSLLQFDTGEVTQSSPSDWRSDRISQLRSESLRIDPSGELGSQLWPYTRRFRDLGAGETLIEDSGRSAELRANVLSANIIRISAPKKCANSGLYSRSEIRRGSTVRIHSPSTIHIWSQPACKGHCRRDLELGCGHISGLLVGLAIEAPALMDFRALRSL